MRTLTIGVLLSLSAIAACDEKTTALGNDATSNTAAASASAAPSTPAIATGPLADLGGVGRRLDEGLAAFLAGKEPADAFRGDGAAAAWDVSAQDLEKLRADLKAAGATSGLNASMELEIIFEKAGKDVYYLRTSVLVHDAHAALFALGGKEPTAGKVSVSSVPVADLTGPGEPFAKAAESLVKALKSPDCAKLPLLSEDDVTKLTTDRLRADLLKSLERARTALPDICTTLSTLELDAMRVRIDDQAFAIKDAEGRAIGALKGSFEASPGKLAYSLDAFRQLK